MLIERRFPSISPILSAHSPSVVAMSIHLADGLKSLTCGGGNNYGVSEQKLR